MFAREIRVLLLTLSVIFLVTYVALAVTAVTAAISILGHDVLQNWTSPLMILMMTCAVTCIVFLIGWCGLLFEKRIFITVFSVLLIILVLCKLVLWIYILNRRSVIGTNLKEDMTLALVKYNNDSTVRDSWDFLQYKLECCGVTDYEDWREVNSILPRWIPVDTKLPHSCCNKLSTEKICTEADAKNVGCYTKVTEFIRSNFQDLLIVILFVGSTQMICSILSVYVAGNIEELNPRQQSMKFPMGYPQMV